MNVMPNPASHRTRIDFGTLEAGEYVLEAFAMDGAKIGGLFEGYIEAKLTYSVDFDVSDLPTGVYVCRLSLKGGGLSVHQKITVVK